MFATPVAFTFDDGEARDDHGRWSDGGGSGGSPATEATKSLAGGYQAADGVVSKAKGIAPALQSRADALSRAMGGRIIDLSHVDPRLQVGVVKAMEQFHERYPAIQVEVASGDPTSSTGRVMISNPEGTMAGTLSQRAFGGTDAQSMVYLNERFFGDPARLADTLDENQVAGFLTRGPVGDKISPVRDDPAEQIMVHELGHALHNSLGTDAYGSPYSQAVRTVLSSDEYKVPHAVRGISEYATQSTHEFIAEAVTNAQGPDPTPLAKLVQSTFDAAYHKRYG